MAPILILNPNTTESVTRLLQQRADLRNDGGRFIAVTARFGASYIACEASYAVAGHAALDRWAELRSEGDWSAVLIGCFGDPGLQALRDCCPVPVTGLAEAAFIEAAAHGRFAIVTGGARWKPMLERLALALGFGPSLAAVHTVAPSGAELARDPEGARALLRRACEEVVERYAVDAVVLGGAALAGHGQAIQPFLSVPVVDSVDAGLALAARLARESAPGPATAAGPAAIEWTGVSPALALLGHPV